MPRKRKAAVTAPSVKTQCPHCLLSFSHMNQHWTQNESCFRKQEAIFTSRSTLQVPIAASLPQTHYSVHSTTSSSSSPNTSSLLSHSYVKSPHGFDVQLDSASSSDDDNDCTVLTIVPPPVQPPGINTVPFVQLQTENLYLDGFSSMALDNYAVFDEFGFVPESKIIRCGQKNLECGGGGHQQQKNRLPDQFHKSVARYSNKLSHSAVS